MKIYPTFHCLDKELLSASKENSLPFTVIGSDSLVNVKGKMVRGRAYKWGACEGFLLINKLRIQNIAISSA